MLKFQAKSAIGEDGKPKLEMSDFIGKAFRDDLRSNLGGRYEVRRLIPESNKMRRWLHGSLIPLITFYQEGLDYRKSEDCDKVFEFLRLEFNGDFVQVAGETKKVGRTTKGQLKDFIEKISDWATEQGYPIELCDPVKYQKWRDEVYSFGAFDHYLDYLRAKGDIR